MSGEVKQTQQHTLRAMAMNYAEGHAWGRLDSEACAKAADEIAALEAECERLRGTMMEVVTKNFAENLGRAAKDKELDHYLSEGIRKLQAERDALAAELAAIKGQSGFDYSIRTQSTNSIPAPAKPAVDIGRNAAFEACPDTGCDWSSFYRGWNAALAAIAKEVKP